MHGLAAMVPKLRQEPGTFGLVTANGGFLSKHAGCVYSTAPYSETHPEATEWQRQDPAVGQAELDAGPELAICESPNGQGSVETYTVIHDRDGPTHAIVIGRLTTGDNKGERFVAKCTDLETMERMKERVMLGETVQVGTDEEGAGQFSWEVARASL